MPEAPHLGAVELGTILNHAYQAGGHGVTLSGLALELRAALPEQERAAFTDAVEMCGLWLDAAEDGTPPDYISVSVKAPDSCPPLAATIHAHPKTAEEFFAILGALPPEAEPHIVHDWISADLGGDHGLHLHAPKSVGGERMPPAETAQTRFIREALEVRAEQMADEADEQRTAAEDDPRGVADR